MEGRWMIPLHVLVTLGWCLSVRSEETAQNCSTVSYTSQNKQRENGLVGCPDNVAYFFIVAAAFIGGLVISYLVLQFIIKCSQIGGVPPKKGATKKEEVKPSAGAKKKEEKKEEKKKEEVPSSSLGANGGVAKT